MCKLLKKICGCWVDDYIKKCSDENLKEYQCLDKTKIRPHWHSFWLPILVFVLFSGIVVTTLCLFEDKKFWGMLLLGLLCAIIILIAAAFILKFLVPYWSKIAELNDKHRESLTRLAEERLDYERLPKKTAIGIMERQSKANIEKNLKNN